LLNLEKNFWDAVFPMKTPDDSKYQKDKYRRVESLFFYLNDVPARKKGVPKIVCSPATDKAHVEKDCPFYHDKHFIANYLNPLEEINMIVYHMKFNAYNPISLRNGYPRNRRLPEGLTLQAVHYVKKGGKTVKEKIKTITKFHNGIYTAKVPDDPKRDDINFEFKAVTQLTPKLERLWIYTKDKDTEPVLIKKFDKDIDALLTPDKYHERLCYYDLPYEWRSMNYFTDYKAGDAVKTYRFQTVIKKKLKLKPYGTEESDVDNPMVFKLDNIVLMDKNGNQVIKDQDKNGNSKELSKKSRLSLFNVSKDELKLYRPRKDSTDALPAEESSFYSQLDFKHELKSGVDVWRNGIHRVPSNTRGIMFCGKFYSVFDKRAGQKAGTWKPSKFQIKGCRAAVLEDTKMHSVMKVKYTNAATHYRYFCEGVGNYELHYIHLACAKIPPETYKGGYKACSFLMVYWNGRFVKRQVALPSPYDPSKTTIQNHTVSNIDMENYEKVGCKNAKKRWEEKGYTLEPVSLDAEKKGNIQIKPVYFFEAKTATRGGKHKCEVKISNDESDGVMGVSSSGMYYLDYTIRHYMTSLNPLGYEDLDGSRFKIFVMAHELGHAQGLDDDYAYHNGHLKNATDGCFRQYYLGMPYQDDEGSLMNNNRAPRTKHIYQIMNRLNDAADDNALLKKTLKSSRYQGIFRYTKSGAENVLKFHLSKSPNDYRDIYKPFKTKRRLTTGTGKVDVALYKMGEDEMSRSIKIGPTPPNPKQLAFPFDGILSVFIKIGFVFKNYTDNSDPSNVINNTWVGADKRNWMRDVRAKIRKFNNRFYLSGTNADFKNTYIYFFPLCLDYKAINRKYKRKKSGTAAQKTAAGNAAELATKNAANITIEVTLNNKLEASARTSPLTKLKVGNSVSAKWIAKAVIGQDPGVIQGKNAAWTAWPNPTAAQVEFVKADFDFIKNWINSASCLNGGAFVVKDS